MSGQGQMSAILLAAGESTRLGRPKQLLPWEGSSLISSTIKKLAAAGCGRLIVVVGAYQSQVREQCIAPSDVQLDIVTNVDWNRGQASSLRAGIEYALADKDIGATVIALCDQPFIEPSHYRELVAKVCRLGYFAAATEYPEGLGVPACLSLLALKSLSVMDGDSGAKHWIRDQPPHIIGRVTCLSAAKDIDTELDYEELNGMIGTDHKTSEVSCKRDGTS